MAARRTSSDSGRKYARGYAPAGSLRGTALTLLGRRDYTSSELRKKLIERGYAPADVEQVLADLSATRLLDDERVAAAHVRTAVGVKGRGRIRVARELAARGISKAVAEAAMATVEAQDEAAALKKILVRKKWPTRPSLAERRRMFQHLMRRGFPVDAIRRALGNTDSFEDPAGD